LENLDDIDIRGIITSAVNPLASSVRFLGLENFTRPQTKTPSFSGRGWGRVSEGRVGWRRAGLNWIGGGRGGGKTSSF